MINYWDILKLAATASEDDILMAWYNLPLDLQTNDLKLFVKANLDPYYRKTLIHYPNLEQLIPAGFFDDGKPVEKISHNINFFTTPIHKILNQFLKIIKEQEKKSTSDLNKPFLVLLNTGSYSPIHLGHLEMMEKAKTLMNEHYHVLGGYLSPSHDAYVSTKYEKTACYHSDARIALCQEVLHDSDWLMLDPWEARYNNQPINFTDVILHLKKYLNKYVEPIINAHVEIGYVFGSDNAGFTWAFIEQGISICFERPSYELPYETVSNDSLLDHKRHFFIPKTTNIQSSKLIREGEHNFLPSKIKELYFNYKDNSYKIDSDIYIIRNDTVYCTQNIHDDNKTIALNTFVQQLHMDLKYAFSPYIHINTLEINAEEQNSYLNSEAFKDKNIINIDNCTYKPEQYSLGLSRVFNIADGQIYSNTLVSRPGLKPLEEQINLIPAGQYSLVDDDIASGRTIALLRKKLPSTIRINEIIALSEISFSKEFK
jgi:nicotinic acid mononucleotide adenylyltransferase